MKDIESALDDIARLRDQLAAGSRFQGLAPGVVALTGGAALGLGAWQASTHSDDLFIWIVLAAMCAMAIGTEAIIRARRLHRSMADRMLNTTLNRFMPAASAAAITGMMVLLYAPEHSRFLPGIWQLLMGVGIFAMITNLPRQMVWAAGFYFASGTAALALSVGDAPAIAWLMGVPFGLGQLLVAAILYRASTGVSHGQK
ncbi:MAG: hypothetical protein ABI810_08850 [Sphingomonas bacterium]